MDPSVYIDTLDNLKNEFDIDVSRFPLFLD
jgi:hypothetical protein